MSRRTLAPDEAAAKRVLLVKTFETQTEGGAAWTVDDGVWATRLARESTPPGASAEALLDARARHALARLQPREPGIARALAARGWRPAWVAAAVVVGLACGLAVDAVGASQHINLLAPPVWVVIAWNLVVYAALLLAALRPRRPPGPRSALTRLLTPGVSGSGPLQIFQLAWIDATRPLTAARAARLLHLAAAAVAVGLVASLYLRGLVLDYRVGWQSTFLAADQVQPVLATLLAPATALTGIAVPDAATLQTLRIAPGTAPTAPAAPWIHLYATMLVLFVVLPRLVLALVAGWRAHRLSRRLPLPAGGLYFQRLLHELRGDTPRVQLLPLGAAPGADAVAGLRLVLAAALGDGVVVVPGAATVYGDEETPPPVDADATLGLVFVDVAATPEADTHGRFVRSLRARHAGLPLVLVADEAGFAERFVGLPARVVERRAAWQRLADAERVPLVAVNLARPDLAAAPAALLTALARI